jgi:nucleoid-associated protein YgaU
MQQIERYGVIALVFLLVTIVAVSFWGDSKSPGFWKRLTGRAVPPKEQVAEAPPPTAERAVNQELPMTPMAPANPDLIAQNNPVTNPANTNGAQQPLIDAGNQGLNPSVQGAPGNQAIPEPPIDPRFQPMRQQPVVPAPDVNQPSQPAHEYVVQKGDSLASIAQRALGDGQRWKEIADINGGLEPKRLKVGMKLQLPTGTAAAPAPVQDPARNVKVAQQPTAPKSAPKKETAVAKPAAKSSGTYVVRGGDTLRSIAESKLGGSQRWKDIVAANPGIDPAHIKVGQELHLPAGAPVPSVAAAVTPRAAIEAPEKPVVR